MWGYVLSRFFKPLLPFCLNRGFLADASDFCSEADRRMSRKNIEYGAPWISVCARDFDMNVQMLTIAQNYMLALGSSIFVRIKTQCAYLKFDALVFRIIT